MFYYNKKTYYEDPEKYRYILKLGNVVSRQGDLKLSICHEAHWEALTSFLV